MVTSPEITIHYYMEPPETYRCFAIVEADTNRAAMIAACRLPDFKEWVDQARGDGVPPYKGLKVDRCLCEHGNCWGCDECQRCLMDHNVNFGALHS